MKKLEKSSCKNKKIWYNSFVMHPYNNETVRCMLA